jgi:hypothetical protein
MEFDTVVPILTVGSADKSELPFTALVVHQLWLDSRRDKLGGCDAIDWKVTALPMKYQGAIGRDRLIVSTLNADTEKNRGRFLRLAHPNEVNPAGIFGMNPLNFTEATAGGCHRTEQEGQQYLVHYGHDSRALGEKSCQAPFPGPFIPSVYRSAASITRMSSHCPILRSISESRTVARLSVITTESESRPIRLPAGEDRATATRLGGPARDGLLVIMTTIV